MKAGVFFSSRNKAIDLLNKYDLLKNSYFIEEKISQEFINSVRKKDYHDAYKIAVKNFDYHLLLFDESFVQFEFKKNKNDVELRYSFFQFPFDFPSYKEYLKSKDLSHIPHLLRKNTSFF